MDRRGYAWLVGLRGVVAIVFGVLAVVWPSITAVVLALLFGAFVVVDGVSAIVAAFRRRGEGAQRVALIILGLIGVAAGVTALVWPGITAVVLAAVVGAWAVVTGIFEIWAAASRRRGDWSLILVGVLSVLAGILILVRPDVGAVSIALVIGVYAIIAGVLQLAAAWRMVRGRSTRPTGTAAPAGI